MKSKSSKPWLTLIVAILFITSVIKVMTEEPKSPRNIPGVNSPDLFVKGCVGCHKNNSELKNDLRLSTILNSWNEKVDPKTLELVQSIDPTIPLKGKHSFKVTEETNIPDACNKCHGKMKNAFSLMQIVHKIHLNPSKENSFISDYQGDCTHCHKLDAAKGTWSIVNGKESDK